MAGRPIFFTVSANPDKITPQALEKKLCAYVSNQAGLINAYPQKASGPLSSQEPLSIVTGSQAKNLAQQIPALIGEYGTILQANGNYLTVRVEREQVEAFRNRLLHARVLTGGGFEVPHRAERARAFWEGASRQEIINFWEREKHKVGPLFMDAQAQTTIETWGEHIFSLQDEIYNPDGNHPGRGGSVVFLICTSVVGLLP